jgi:hypothetical protein
MSGTEYLTLVLLREEDGNTNHVMFHKSLPRHDFRLPGGRPTTLPYGPTAGMCPHGSVDELKFPVLFLRHHNFHFQVQRRPAFSNTKLGSALYHNE